MRHMLLRALVLIGAVCLPTIAHAQSEAVEYYHTDVIGTVRLITNASGQVKEAFDYLPFGEAWPGDVTSSGVVENGAAAVYLSLLDASNDEGSGAIDLFERCSA